MIEAASQHIRAHDYVSHTYWQEEWFLEINIEKH